ncbi:MAG: family 43 glycosylhydrolase [Bacteroidales bacterium]|nr:family 43 glycosylhydrolase [Bacteroidales bacterium]
MDKIIRHTIVATLASALLISCTTGTTVQPAKTYCNPIDLDYTYMVYNSDRNLSYRSGADPAVVRFKGEYYMFVTRSLGYWHSTDLCHWEFLQSKSTWYPQGSNAPAAHNYRDSLLFVTGDPSGAMSILYTEDPKGGIWTPVPAILHDLQDPDLFIDDDGQAYMFWGSSNDLPIRGKKLNMNDRFLVEGPTVPLFYVDSTSHGWERFGENHGDNIIGGYIEGAWLSKLNDRYYMLYGAPGTEFNVYGDGVYTADSPLGPYTYQPHNPVFYKPGGFINGAGHGSLVEMADGSLWHFGTMSLSATVNWERRICLMPAFIDEEGIMYGDNAYGDYPHYAPGQGDGKGGFAGWMLLSYRKPVTVSSVQEGRAAEAEGFDEWNRPQTSPDFCAANLTDENCKTYWLAQSNSDKEWVVIDLEDDCTIHALQINYYDHQANLYGRIPGLCHRFTIEASSDGENWTVIEDRSDSNVDAPNAYIELTLPIAARYIRYNNVKVPSNSLAISEIRVFGRGSGEAPQKVSGLKVILNPDGKEARLSWDAVSGAQGYNVRWGISRDRLYSSWLVYSDTELDLRCLNAGTEYFFSVEAFNENGISEPVCSFE